MRLRGYNIKIVFFLGMNSAKRNLFIIWYSIYKMV